MFAQIGDDSRDLKDMTFLCPDRVCKRRVPEMIGGMQVTKSYSFNSIARVKVSPEHAVIERQELKALSLVLLLATKKVFVLCSCDE